MLLVLELDELEESELGGACFIAVLDRSLCAQQSQQQFQKQ